MKTQELAVTINQAENRFELELEGKLSFLRYFPKDDQTLVLTHTEVPANLKSSRIGSLLIDGMIQYIQKYNLKIIPLCSSVTSYLLRHPEYNHLVSPDYLKVC